jgi:hypothetical protein
MDQTSSSVPAKGHFKSFWPLTVIFIVAALLGILVYWFQFTLVTDYDLQSMQLSVHARRHDLSSAKAPAKTKSAASSGAAK